MISKLLLPKKHRIREGGPNETLNVNEKSILAASLDESSEKDMVGSTEGPSKFKNKQTHRTKDIAL